MKMLARTPAIAVLAFAGAASAQSFPADLSAEAIGTWAPAHTTLKPGDLVSVGGGRLVAVVDRRPDSSNPAWTRITVRTEIVESGAAAQVKALSEAQDLVLDCAVRKAKAGPMRLYPERNLKGAPRTTPGWDEWAGGEATSVLGRIIDAGCRKTVAADPLLGAAFAKPTTVAPPRPVQSSAELPPIAAPAPPPPVVAQAEAPPPAPPPPPPPPPPPTSAPPPPPAPAAEAAPPPAPPRPVLRNLFVQVAAANSQAAAEGAHAQARAAAPELFGARTPSVEPTVVGGQTFYRALFSGFGSVGEAKGVCEAAQAKGQACILRVK